MKIRTILTKGTSLMLSIMMMASFLPAQVYAVTYRENHEQTEGWNENVAVVPEDNDVTVKGGDISYDGRESDYGGSGALYVEASSDEDLGSSTANVTTGSVTYSSEETDEEASSVYVYVSEGNANVTVNGDVTINGNFDPDAEEPILRDGIFSQNNDGETNVTVNGNVNGVYSGIHSSYDNIRGKTNITVNGDVNGGAGGIVAFNSHGLTDIKVTGDLNGVMTGAIVLNDFKLHDVEDGDDEDEGDVSSPGIVDIRVDGTISAADPEGVGVMVYGRTEGIKVTTWAITPNKDGWVAATYTDDNVLEQDKDFEEKNINYIIRVDADVPGATLSASQETAIENQKVYLRIDLKDGYMITGAYDNNGISGKNILLQDENGYYVVVPKGGGVFLTVSVNAKIIQPQPVTGSGDSGASEGATLCASIAQMILNAAPGATVTVNIPIGTSLCKEAVDALEVRRDITLVVNYGFNDGMYSATVPANTELAQYKNAAGGIDFTTLTVNFNGKPIY